MTLNQTTARVLTTKLISALCCVCFMFGHTTSYATELDTEAAVSLLFGLTIVEDREIDFGSLSGVNAADCTMAIGGVVSGSATGCVGAQTSASFTITGFRFRQITVSVLPGTSDGITFTPTFGPSTTLTGFLPPGGTAGTLAGEATLEVVGELSWDSTVASGQKVIPYTFVADFN